MSSRAARSKDAKTGIAPLQESFFAHARVAARRVRRRPLILVLELLDCDPAVLVGIGQLEDVLVVFPVKVLDRLCHPKRGRNVSQMAIALRLFGISRRWGHRWGARVEVFVDFVVAMLVLVLVLREEELKAAQRILAAGSKLMHTMGTGR